MIKILPAMLVACHLASFLSYSQTPLSPAAGDGTESDPYQITSLENLRWIAENPEHWGAHFIQLTDIDASETKDWEAGAGWAPIGNENTMFTGSYNGQGHIIDRLFINRPGASEVGFIGTASSARIDSLGIINADIAGGNNTGILIGSTQQVNVSNCFSTGNVYGSLFIGGLIGQHENYDGINNPTKIINCYTKVVINYNPGFGLYMGGLIGRSSSTGEDSIISSYSISNIVGSSNIGGLIGINSTIISNCYAIADISGQRNLGGLVGTHGGGLVTRSYASCFIHILSPNLREIGGLIGGNAMDNPVEDSFWNIDISNLNNSRGGTGKSNSEMQDVATFTSLTSEGLLSPWDFADNPNDDTGDENIWNINLNYNGGYPYFNWKELPLLPEVLPLSFKEITQNSATANAFLLSLGNSSQLRVGFCWNTSGMPTIDDNKKQTEDLVEPGIYTGEIENLMSETNYYIRAYIINEDEVVTYSQELRFTTLEFGPEIPSGQGTENDPYQISNLAKLYWLALNNDEVGDKHFIQTADINAEISANLNDGKGWPGIGHNYYSFRGSYNGRGYNIENLFINDSTADNMGLFSRIQNGIIDSIILINVNISGNAFVGGLAGAISGQSSVMNSRVSGSVLGINSVGGLVGHNNNSLVVNCSSHVTIIGYTYTGGLVGTNNGRVSRSFSGGNTIGYHDAGGLIGGNFNGMVDNCYSFSGTSGIKNTGGLVGLMNHGTISNCYSRGRVTGETSVGGLVGYVGVETSSIISNSFWDVENSGQTISAGGKGKESHELKERSLFIDAGWDFFAETANGEEDIWGIYHPVEDGYPFLIWQGHIKLSVVKSEIINEVSDSSASGIGIVIDPGKPSEILQHGYCWNEEGSPTIQDWKTEEGPAAEADTFTTILPGLRPYHNYSTRAYLITEIGTSYGEEIEFKTEKRELKIGGSFIPESKEYDGQINAQIMENLLELIGIHEGDEVFIQSLEVEYEDKVLGKDIAVIITQIAIEGSDAFRYNLSLDDAPMAEGEILQRTLTIEGSFTVYNKTIDSTRTAELESNNLALSLVIDQEDVKLINVVLEFESENIGNDIPVRIVSAEIEGEDAPNYILSLENSPVGMANITPPEVTLLVEYEGYGEVIINDTLSIFGTSELIFYENSEIHLRGKSNDLNRFMGWAGDLFSKRKDESIIMDDHKTIIAVFLNPLSAGYEEQLEIHVYPNPFDNFLKVAYSIHFERITLINLTGEILRDIPITGNGVEVIPVSELEAGMYIITLQSIKHGQISKKVIKK